MTTYINRGAVAATYYRPTAYTQPPRTVVPDVRDDYERWYTETVPNNRMSLSIRSGIHSEVGWALDRLCRLVHNEQFLFSSIPGVIDGLFDWPEWYITEGYKQARNCDLLFSSPVDQARQRRYALESLFVLRTAALHEPNARELAAHSHTLPLILNALHNLDHATDENSEALLHIVEIFHVVAPNFTVYPTLPPGFNPILPLLQIASQSSNRSMIISSLAMLATLFSNPANGIYLTSESPALTRSIQYLPLVVDKPLIEASLNYLYVHISHPSMARAFLLHSEMPAVIKVLVSLLLHEQQALEKTFTLDVTGPIYTAPSTSHATRDHELTKEELDSLLPKPEPQRCYDWMRTMFVSKVEGELTQVDFWNLYKDAFSPFAEQYPLLVASDVIKNVTNVFPQAQAMVLQIPTQRFVVRGVDRRKEIVINERYRCHWDRAQCPAQPFPTASELYAHLQDHLPSDEIKEAPCLWTSCSQIPLSKVHLSLHVLTHVASSQPSQKHPSQSDTITLPSEDFPHPTEAPTSRPIPPPRSTTISYPVPVADPPSTSLTALLVIRILFRTSFASADAAPRVDADHFGFPGIVEDTEDPAEALDTTTAAFSNDKEGERRGRKAFVAIRHLLTSVNIHDEALMDWIGEMMDAGITGTSS